MTCIISTTYDDKYFFFLPIVIRNLKLLGLTTVAVMPEPETELERNKLKLVNTVQPSYTHPHYNLFFKAPEHKKATYAQIARLFACPESLPDTHIVFTSDIDMLLFKQPPYYEYSFCITGADLVPENQFPMCYISAPALLWRREFIKDRSLQECLDDLLAEDECQDYRSCRWSRDQEIAYNVISKQEVVANIGRNNGAGFAKSRIDRDDAHWQSSLNHGTFDAHLWRPGYDHLDKILQTLQYFYPNENFAWITEYANAYRQLIGV